MKILIIGGTKFLGRHLAEAALAQGHEITLFNRGKTNPHLFPAIEKICGDRDGVLDALKGRYWDAAIDTCGYVSAQVRATTGLLADSVGHYTFISSISVYRDFRETGLDESAPTAILPSGPSNGEINGEHYGANKALCERTAERAMPGRVLIIRPGIIAGPHDPTDRFTHWARRTALGGEVLCPGSAETPVQIIDARDLSEWIIRMVGNRQVGCFNAAGPAFVLTFQQMLEQCRIASGSNTSFIWVGEKFLLDRKVDCSNALPFWIPKKEKTFAGFFSIDCKRALTAGLTFRPLTETAREALAAAHESTNGANHSVGLKANAEAALLKAWKAKARA
jgi:2'-hydroxyisoflavone reductase